MLGGKYDNLPLAFREAIRKGLKIQAIKEFRQFTGASLMISKNFVDQVYAEYQESLAAPVDVEAAEAQPYVSPGRKATYADYPRHELEDVLTVLLGAKMNYNSEVGDKIRNLIDKLARKQFKLGFDKGNADAKESVVIFKRDLSKQIHKLAQVIEEGTGGGTDRT